MYTYLTYNLIIRFKSLGTLLFNYKNIEYVCDDVFKTYRDAYLNINLIINTSCEHMSPMKEWPWFRFSSMETDYMFSK